MYLKYFNLISKPFEISPDPRFLWLGEKHKEGLATLKYGISTNKGFMSLTGDVGTGKTTLLNALANFFDDNFIIARIPDPSLEAFDFFNVAANAFARDKQFRGKCDFLSELTIFLNKAYAVNKEVILIVDEAQRIKQELLEDIRLLSNIEKQEKKLINIIFAGQNDFNDIIIKNKALMNRLAINFKIEPLTEYDTVEYIQHRLKIAGSKSRIFSPSAIREIYSYSKGNPRQINIICDLALLHAYSAEASNVGPPIIKECIKKTLIPFEAPEPLAEYPKIQEQVPMELNQKKPSRYLGRSWNSAFHGFKSIFSRPNAAYLPPIPLIVLVSLIGLMYYPASYNSSISKLKTYFEQVINRFVEPISNGSLQNAQVLNVPTSMQFDLKPKVLGKNLGNENNSDEKLTEEFLAQADTSTSLQNELEKARAELAKLKKHLHISRQATALLKTQVKELHDQKAALEKQLASSKTAQSRPIDNLDELKTTQTQAAELKNALSLKDRVLSESEQRRKELEIDLHQAKSTKSQLDSKLSEQSALVADLQNKLQASRGQQASLEAQLEKSRQETERVQTQLKQVSIQKTSSETQFKKLQTANNALAADREELKVTKAQLAELKNVLAAKERLLLESEQRQQEIEKYLEQAQSGKGQLDSELSVRDALVADLQKKLQAARGQQASLEAQLEKSRQETERVQTQLKQVSIQKTSSETQLKKLHTANNALAADREELKVTKAQVAELKNALAAKDRLLMQGEQRQHELEKKLEQTDNSKEKLDSEFSAQAVLIADLQNKLESSRGEQDSFEAQLQKSRQEMERVQTQLKQLSIQKNSSETQLKKLQTANNALAADHEELKRNLMQAESSQDLLDSELSAQVALFADLQRKLEASRREQVALEAQLQKSRQENLLVQTQLENLKAKKRVSPVKPVAFDSQKKPLSEKDLTEKAAEAPDPANIIDWVLKKKSK